MTQQIYLDNQATTPVDLHVLEVMHPYFNEHFGNASSTHLYGMRAEQGISRARQQAAKAIGCAMNEIVFTSGATESNNQVIKGVYDYYRKQRPHIVVSAVEHKCILESAQHIKKQGADVTTLAVDRNGVVDPRKLKEAIRPNTVLVSVMMANNEIGSINPIADLAKICHQKNILFHTDAAQAIGKIPVDVNLLDIDFLSASAHKFYGPKGSGFLYIRNMSKKYISPLLDGGGQESNLRSGTLNTPGIVGLGEAIEIASCNLETNSLHYRTLRDRLYSALLDELPGLLLNGTSLDSKNTPTSALQRLPNNLNFSLKGIDMSLLKRRVSHIAFSSGSACSSSNLKPSYVLKAIGLSDADANSSFRFGIGKFNVPEEIDVTVKSLVSAIRSL